MARFFFVTILFCWMTTVFSQGKVMGMTPVAPDAVLKGFIKNYGDEKVSWKVNEENYEASFKLIGMPAIAWYDSTGHRINVEVEIKPDQLPSIAMAYIGRNYPKTKIVKAFKWTDDKKTNTFQADLKLSAESKSLLFSARGDLIKELGGE